MEVRAGLEVRSVARLGVALAAGAEAGSASVSAEF